MRTEDVLRGALAGRAESAPLTIDGREMLARVSRREAARRRLQLGAVAAAVGVLAVGGAVWRGLPADRAPVASLPSPSPSASRAGQFPVPGPDRIRRVVFWQDLSFKVPADWTVNDTHESHPTPSGALLDGPFLGTLRTGPMCWTNHDGSGGCSRAHGIRDRRPTDGVVAWINAGQSAQGSGATGDPGPEADVCPPPSAVPFHAYRVLPSQDGDQRVTLDGCAYGTHAKDYVAQLQLVAASLATS